MDSVPPRDVSTSFMDVLPLVLHHSSISSRARTLCLLLCTSQQAAAAVKQNFIGRVQLRARVPAQMAWFSKHWRLVQSLDTDAEYDAEMMEAIEEGLAAAATGCDGTADQSAYGALQPGGGTPQLQSVKAIGLPPAALGSLAALSTLTSLSFELFSGAIAAVEKEATALHSLTSLRHLAINAPETTLLPGPSLTNLTSLSVDQLTQAKGWSQLQHLPPQLLEMTMTLCLNMEPQPPIELSHLTALTRLVATGDGGDNFEGVAVGYAAAVNNGSFDKLPPNCIHLAVEEVLAVEPLLQLQQLQRLEITHYHYFRNRKCDDAFLQPLSSLSSLSDLQVCINASEFSSSSLSFMPSLRGLHVWYQQSYQGAMCKELSVRVVGMLAMQSALQRLDLRWLELPSSSDCKLADQLRGLSGLQSLWLYGCVVIVQDCRDPSAEFAGFVAGLVSMPQLRQLRLADLQQWDAAASAAGSSNTADTAGGVR